MTRRAQAIESQLFLAVDRDGGSIVGAVLAWAAIAASAAVAGGLAVSGLVVAGRAKRRWAVRRAAR